MNLTIAEAKERVSIGALWHEFGYPTGPGKSSRCPFHEDKSPSFSVFDDGRRWKCFAGCGEGDVIDFLAKVKNLSNEEACKEILRRAGANDASDVADMAIGLLKQHIQNDGVELPPFVEYHPKIAQAVADSRGIDITAVEFAALRLKTVVFAKVCEQKCWILTDASHRAAEARRIDREPFPAIGTLAERKSHTLAGSSKSWPVGILPGGFDEPWLKQHVHKLLLIEGGPDYLAACQLIAAQDENVLPVAMLGASQSICADALPYFSSRRVTIAAHGDEAGRGAGLRWAKQIKGARGLVRLVNMKRGDLCDAVAEGSINKVEELV